MSLDRHRPKHPLLNQEAHSRRLVRLIVLLGLMLFGVYWASQGKNWEWLTGPKVGEPELKELDLAPRRRVRP